MSELERELKSALKEAIGAIEIFHGRAGWELYRDHSPEMKRWNALLATPDVAAQPADGALRQQVQDSFDKVIPDIETRVQITNCVLRALAAQRQEKP